MNADARHHALDLADCAAVRQTLLARPPAATHATLVVLLILITTAVLWAALAEVDLVVKAPGRLRALDSPRADWNAVTGERLCALEAGEVVAVQRSEGEAVAAGDAILVLRSPGLADDMSAAERRLAAARSELATLERQPAMHAAESSAERARLFAELQAAETTLRIEDERRTAEVALAELGVRDALRRSERLAALARDGIVSASEAEDAESSLREAETRLREARCPLDPGRLEILRRELELAERRNDLRSAELAVQLARQRGEIAVLEQTLSALVERRDRLTIRVAQAGLLTELAVARGDYVQRGQTVAHLADTAGLRFDGLLPSRDLAHIDVGTPVRVKLDAFDYQKYGTLAGRVEHLAPDASPTEDGTFFLVSVRLEALDVDAFGGELRIGMTGVSEIITESETLLSLALRGLRRQVVPL